MGHVGCVIHRINIVLARACGTSVGRSVGRCTHLPPSLLCSAAGHNGSMKEAHTHTHTHSLSLSLSLAREEARTHALIIYADLACTHNRCCHADGMHNNNQRRDHKPWLPFQKIAPFASGTFEKRPVTTPPNQVVFRELEDTDGVRRRLF